MPDRHVVSLEVVIGQRLPVVVVPCVPAVVLRLRNQRLGIVNLARPHHVGERAQNLARLPVSLGRRHELGNVEPLEARADLFAEPLADRRRLGVHVDPDESTHLGDLKRREANSVSIEVLAEATPLGHGRQRAVEAIRPAVVRTAQHFAAGPAPVGETRSAVPTDVGERP